MTEVFLFGILMIVCYNIPSIVAIHRRHPQTLQILIVNILFGWTILGWMIAFVWSIMPIPEDERIDK